MEGYRKKPRRDTEAKGSIGRAEMPALRNMKEEEHFRDIPVPGVKRRDRDENAFFTAQWTTPRR